MTSLVLFLLESANIEEKSYLLQSLAPFKGLVLLMNYYIVKPVLSSQSKIDKTKVF